MTIVFGEQKIEARPWSGDGSGKALLITADQGIKRRILTAMDESPDAFELLTDEPDVEDLQGVLPVIVDREKVGLFVNLENMLLGVCVCEEAEETEE